jgi:hypothetical protein
MDKVFLAPEMLATLSALKQTVQLCAPDGQVLGRFTPIGAPDPDDHGRPFVSEDELRKRETRKEGRTWAEIRADLEKRG